MSVGAEAGLPTVSVVMPSYQGAQRITVALTSLTLQTLPTADFEVVVVLNGRPDGTAAVLSAFRDQHPTLQIRVLQVARPSAGEARNVGLAAARGRFTTFLDDDDSVSPRYLAALLQRSDAETVGLSFLADVTEGSGTTYHAGSNRYQLALPDTTVPAHELVSALGFTAGKMLPTSLARAVGFDPDLASGEDVDFWARAFAKAHFRFGLCQPDDGAIYRRHVRANSVSRQVASFDFNVRQRMDVIERLDALRDQSPTSQTDRVVALLERGQVGFINRYLQERPDEHRAVMDEVSGRGLERFPYQEALKGLARHLAVLYVALPYSDTSAFVAARRIRARGEIVDVLSSNMKSLKDKDHSAQTIWREYVDQTTETPTRPVSIWWPDVTDFCKKGMRTIEEWESEKGPYVSVYSRVMWPAAHILAALYKVRRPETEWIAEFSDPLLHDINGKDRDSAGQPDPEVLDEFRAAFSLRGLRAPETDNMYVWIESLAYALADTVLFTNEHQRDFMLGYCADPELAQRARERAVVLAHPTLPADFYTRVRARYALPADAVNVAYFGVFYATRGLTEVVEAMRALDPDLRRALRLHVFTAKPADLEQEMRDAGLDDVVLLNPYVDYLEFLNLTTHFDALLVNDARTAGVHSVNPYMPSKWSDYAGSGTPIWGVVEPGSILSTRPLTYRSELGDVEGARAVLEQIVVDTLATRHDAKAGAST